jgi:hypothetical protein
MGLLCLHLVLGTSLVMCMYTWVCARTNMAMNQHILFFEAPHEASWFAVTSNNG